MILDTLMVIDMKGVADMKRFRLFTVSTETSPDRCDAACRDRGRRELMYDEAARKAIRL
jgi:hypothetical protein